MQESVGHKNLATSAGSTRALAEDIRKGRLTPLELVQRYLDRIANADPYVRAWRQLDGERALEIAEKRTEEAAEGRFRGALHGIPVGVKDIIDVEGLSTLCNCKDRADRPPETADAEIVVNLKQAGAIVLGKLHTTEFAFFDPSPARNPYNTDHTPGGSSSGSGAAVGAGMVPLALGTQTVASVNRPAAYCGVSAFKPSTRSICGHGIAPLAPSYDTVGFYGETPLDAAFAYETVMPPFARADAKPAPEEALHILLLEDPLISDMDGEMRQAWEEMADGFAKTGATVDRRPSPIPFERLQTLQWSTMLWEASRVLGYLLERPKGNVGEKLLDAIKQGLDISEDQYFTERSEIDELRHTLLRDDTEIDAYLWPAAPTTAPEGIGWTGDPKYISPWTAIGGPVVTIPAGLASNGLPLGCILTSAPGTDLDMMRMLKRLTADQTG